MDSLNKSVAQRLKAEKKFKQIIEMMEQSIAIAEKLGKHPLDYQCACMACVTRKKRLFQEHQYEPKFFL